MSEHIVAKSEAGMRLDRWLKSRLPGLSFSLTQKLMRKGAIKVNGKKAKGDTRVEPGDTVRVPELENAHTPMKHAPRVHDASEAAVLLDNIIYRDDKIIAINKPQGLATQGGSKVRISVDALLDHLKFGAPDRPKLVHRIDKDTSGVLVLARDRIAANELMHAFKSKDIRKIYYALVVGVPEMLEGKITARLSEKQKFGNSEITVIDEKEGKSAITYYKVIDKAAGKKLSWVAMMPLTGRTHQLRAHMAHIGHPIIGDGKYGRAGAFIEGLADTMHLHARRIILPDGQDIEAPFPQHIMQSLKLFEFSASRKELRKEEREMLNALDAD